MGLHLDWHLIETGDAGTPDVGGLRLPLDLTERTLPLRHLLRNEPSRSPSFSFLTESYCLHEMLFSQGSGVFSLLFIFINHRRNKGLFVDCFV